MKKIFVLSLVAISLMLSLCAFQCSSSDITSARLYMNQKNWAKAEEFLQKEVKTNPKSDEGYFLLGQVYYEQSKYTEMDDAFSKSLAISPKNKEKIEAYKTNAWANAYNKGVVAFNKAEKVSPDSVKIVYSQAANLFNQAIAIRPDSSVVYRTLAVTYVKSNEPEKAVAALENKLKLKKEKEEIALLGELALNVGTTARKNNDSVKAAQYINKAIDVLSDGIKTFPDDTNILNLLAQAYIDADKTEVAMDTFKALAEKNPENETNQYNYGVLLLGANKYEDAIAAFKKAIDLKPDYQNAIYNIAVAYVKWGSDLSKEANKSTKIDPEAEKEYRGKFEQALPYLKSLTDEYPGEIRYWDTIAKVYAVLGMSKESTQAYDQVDKISKGQK